MAILQQKTVKLIYCAELYHGLLQNIMYTRAQKHHLIGALKSLT